MATLEVITESDGRQLYDLTAHETVVGRNQFCDVVLRSQTVSRQHARILRSPEGYYLEDLTSLNGTYVNRRRVEGRTQLKDQDLIDIYEIGMIFHERSRQELEAAQQQEIDELIDEVLEEEEPELAPIEPHSTRVLDTLKPSRGEQPDVGAQARFRAALKITTDLGGGLDLDGMLPKILDSLFEIFPQADRGYVLMAEEPDGYLVPRAIKHRQTDSGHSMTFGPISRKTAARVMSEGEAILVDDSQTTDMSQSVFDVRILSMICAPLMGPSRKPMGIIYVDTDDPQRRFVRADLNVLATVATIAGQAVESAADSELGIDMGRRKREMSTAREVQLNFLPQRRPEIAGYRFYDYYLPADEVGGDYFGYIPLPDGRLALSVGDVAGKGVSAALLMAHFCSAVRYCLATSATPAEAVERLNQDLTDETANYHFVTFVLCVLDPAKHLLTVVNAGHMPPLRRRGEGREVEELGGSESGLPLGCEPERGYRQIEVPLEPGDTIVLYTDGISEAMSIEGTAYGAGTIRSVVAKGPDDVARLGETLLADVRRFAQGRVQSDDICLVCFGRSRK